MSHMKTDPRHAVVAAAWRWWVDLWDDDASSGGRGQAEDADTGSRPRRGNRAGRARLRRAHTALDALMLPETHALLQAVRNAVGTGNRGFVRDDRLVRFAILAGHLRPTTGRVRFANLLGRTSSDQVPSESAPARLSPLRFEALMRALELEDDTTLPSLRRSLFAVPEGAHLNSRALLRDILFMNDRTRRDWTYEYWQTNSPADSEPAVSLAE